MSSSNSKPAMQLNLVAFSERRKEATYICVCGLMLSEEIS